MSGGQRCNVVPGYVSIDKDYYTDSSLSALRAIFSSWTLEECLEWLSEDIGLKLSLEETSNKYFPTSNSSREVRDKLVDACEGCGVQFQYNASVEGLNLIDGEWHCILESGEAVKGVKIVFATGGKSFPLVRMAHTSTGKLLCKSCRCCSISLKIDCLFSTSKIFLPLEM